MQCLKPALHFFHWSSPLLGGAPKSLQDYFTEQVKEQQVDLCTEEQVEEARPEEAAMVPVEAQEPLLAAVEDGAVVAVETAKEPPALNSLQSCGGSWQTQCLQTPPCQKHAVSAAFMQMIAADPVFNPYICGWSPVQTPVKKSRSESSLVSPPSREQCAEWGRKGAEKRKAWLMEHQGEVKKNVPRLTNQQKAMCLKQLEKTMPPSFSHSWKQKAYWREQAHILKVTEVQLKNCWKRRAQKGEEDDKIQGFRDRYWRKRYGKKVGDRKNKPGAGKPRLMKEYEQDLKRQIKVEEEAHGHALGPDDILLLWREKLSEVAVQLYREQKNLGEGESLPKKKAKQLQKATTNLGHFAESKSRAQVKADLLKAMGRTALAVQWKNCLALIAILLFLLLLLILLLQVSLLI